MVPQEDRAVELELEHYHQERVGLEQRHKDMRVETETAIAHLLFCKSLVAVVVRVALVKTLSLFHQTTKLEMVAQVREKIPVFKDRRPELYHLD